ncbi:MAG TPA: hypothetical protein VK449_06055 [Anaerolineales bacterium]|nr:hypothetical protein [Anaerolineales bacterium]
MRPPSTDLDAWIEFARRQRLAGWAAFLIDSLEPVAPLGAQMLYLLEPVLGRSAARGLAHALEDGQARAELRRQLNEEPPA